MEYTCGTCGALANKPGHLCNPCDDENVVSFCGNKYVDTGSVCIEKFSAMKFTCGQCGRGAVEEGHLCKPMPKE